MDSNVTSKNVSGFTLAGPPCIYVCMCVYIYMCVYVCVFMCGGVFQDKQRSSAKEHLCHSRLDEWPSWYWNVRCEWTTNDQVHVHGKVEEIATRCTNSLSTDLTDCELCRLHAVKFLCNKLTDFEIKEIAMKFLGLQL